MRPDHDHTYLVCMTHTPQSINKLCLGLSWHLRYEEAEPQNKGPHQLGAAKKEKKVVSSLAISTRQVYLKGLRAVVLS